MRTRELFLIFALVISASLLLVACGDSEPSPEEREAAREEREARQVQSELQELRRRYPAGKCGELMFVNAHANCGFAKNVSSVYYAHVGTDAKSYAPYNPVAKRDQRVRCTDTTPVHKCTGEDHQAVYFWTDE